MQAVLDAAERGLIPGGQYDAVLIDEAHDFEPQWLALAAKMVNPDTKALMIVYDDAQAIAEWLLGRKAAGYQWGQMAVLYPRHFIGERFEKILAKSGIPVNVAKDHGNHIQTERDEVRFLSMHNAKGLEFPCVVIGGLGELKKAEDIEDDISLTYVAITRATHEAFITYSNRSELVGRLVM